MTKIAKELLVDSLMIFVLLMLIGQFDTEFDWLMSWYWMSAGFAYAYWVTDIRKLAMVNDNKGEG